MWDHILKSIPCKLLSYYRAGTTKLRKCLSMQPWKAQQFEPLTKHLLSGTDISIKSHQGAGQIFPIQDWDGKSRAVMAWKKVILMERCHLDAGTKVINSCEREPVDTVQLETQKRVWSYSQILWRKVFKVQKIFKAILGVVNVVLKKLNQNKTPNSTLSLYWRNRRRSDFCLNSR